MAPPKKMNPTCYDPYSKGSQKAPNFWRPPWFNMTGSFRVTSPSTTPLPQWLGSPLLGVGDLVIPPCIIQGTEGTKGELGIPEDGPGFLFLRCLNGGFQKLGAPFLGVLIVRIIICWSLFWGPLFMEAPHLEPTQVKGSLPDL